jgi:hypothetical protein
MSETKKRDKRNRRVGAPQKILEMVKQFSTSGKSTSDLFNPEKATISFHLEGK